MVSENEGRWIPGFAWLLLGIVVGVVALISTDAQIKGKSVNWNLFGQGYGWNG